MNPSNVNKQKMQTVSYWFDFNSKNGITIPVNARQPIDRVDVYTVAVDFKELENDAGAATTLDDLKSINWDRSAADGNANISGLNIALELQINSGNRYYISQYDVINNSCGSTAYMPIHFYEPINVDIITLTASRFITATDYVNFTSLKGGVRLSLVYHFITY